MIATGSTIAGYRIEGVLGRGGMGVVYEATQLSLERTVALKLLAPHLSDDDGFRRRFRREAQLQASLDHPHVVPVYESGEAPEGLYIVMKIVRGRSLKDIILEHPIEPARAVAILSQVADALDAAHGLGIVHRDVKPQNILVGERDAAFLADFGLTKGADEKGLTRTGQYLGTLDYIAPEQLNGNPSTAQSDLYSLGGVLFECLSSVVPYPRDTDAAILFAHAYEPPPELSVVRPDLPRALDAVIARAMAKNAADRFTSARDMLAEAGHALEVSKPSLASVAETAHVARSPGETVIDPAQREATPLPVVRRSRRGRKKAAPAAAEQVTPAVRTAVPVAGATIVDRPDRDLPDAAGGGTPGHTRVRLIPVLIAGLVSAVALGTVGFISAPPRAEATTETMQARHGLMRLSYPEHWIETPGSNAVEGVSLSNAFSLRPADATTDVLLAGTTDAGGPDFLPKGLQERAGPPQEVQLASHAALRYDFRGVDGERGILYVVPTSAGAATVICRAPGTTAASVSDECESIATTLRISGAQVRPVHAVSSYAEAVNKVFATLDKAVASGRSKLASGKTAAKQAAAAAAVAAAYDAAAKSIRSAAPIGSREWSASERIVDSLSDQAKAYRTLADAARKLNASRYTAARNAIAARDTRVAQDLEELGGLGYAIRKPGS